MSLHNNNSVAENFSGLPLFPIVRYASIGLINGNKLRNNLFICIIILMCFAIISIFCIITSVFCIINSVFCIINSIFCIINSVFCIINSIFYTRISVFCIRISVFCNRILMQSWIKLILSIKKIYCLRGNRVLETIKIKNNHTVFLYQ